MPSVLDVELEPSDAAAPFCMSGTPSAAWHQPVMSAEVLRALDPKPGEIIVDGTVGTGGHSALILPGLLPDGQLIAVDRDPLSLGVAQQRLSEFTPQARFVHENYRHLPSILQSLGYGHLDGLLLDLGMSSPQVDRAERGFSFLKDGPLDMRMDPGQAMTAERLVNRSFAEELADLIATLGEERFAKRIARAIVRERQREPIATTTQLAQLITRAVPPGARHGRLHPATRTFQALRMAVNDELGALDELLGALPQLLNPGGRVVIMAFHSLEDRRVKHAFAQGMRDGLWTVLTKKPITPSEDEMLRNPRARSAKLRAIERV